MRLTKNYAPYRIFGYATALTLQAGNGIIMLLALHGDILKEPEIQTFASLQWVYVTIWNVVCQIIYSFLGIICDLPTLLETKEHRLIKYLKAYREILFAGIFIPIGFFIPVGFWPIYLYDRELVFPLFIDKVLSQVSNHIMHTAILPFMIWEFVFLPKCVPDTHKWNLAHLYGYYIAYVFVLFSAYNRLGAWPYPFMKLAFGTIYFPMIFISAAIIVNFFYIVQWPINKLVWVDDQTPKENILKQKIN